jgi:hypothetical protein
LPFIDDWYNGNNVENFTLSVDGLVDVALIDDDEDYKIRLDYQQVNFNIGFSKKISLFFSITFGCHQD